MRILNNSSKNFNRELKKILDRRYGTIDNNIKNNVTAIINEVKNNGEFDQH